MSLSINSANNNVSVTGNANLQTGNKVNSHNEGSIFGDVNGNSVIDKEDFVNEADLKMFEEKGLLGQTWDKALDFVNGLRHKNNAPEISEKAQQDINDTLKFLKEDNINFTMDNDYTVRFKEDNDLGFNGQYSWSGDISTLTATSNRTNGNVWQHTVNLESGATEDAYESASGYKQVYKYDADGNEIARENYKKDDKGKYQKIDNYLITSYSDENFAQIYTGSDIAILINSKSNDEVNEFCKDMSASIVHTSVLRDGGSTTFSLSDGTTIDVDRYWGSSKNGYVTILQPDGHKEVYKPDGTQVE